MYVIQEEVVSKLCIEHDDLAHSLVLNSCTKWARPYARNETHAWYKHNMVRNTWGWYRIE